MPIVPKDVIFLPESTAETPDRWVAMNVFARTSLGISAAVFGLLGAVASDAEAGGSGPFRCWRIEYFSNEAGLLADPSRFRRDLRDWEEVSLRRDELLAELKKHCILVDDEAAYRKRFQPKRHLLDRENFGNFHQQHGQHMALARRKDPADWWMRQKFSEDQLSVRPDTLYGAIQSSFLEKYTEERIGEGMSVIDLGCGTGVYSNLMASRGASVLGVDPSEEYLVVARANAREGTRFENMKIGQVGGLDAIPTGSADVVFMSDALLFYYLPFYPGQNADIAVLLGDIRRILKPGGSFVSLEPHGVFYLMPWLGAQDRPFVVVTEYLRKSFGIVPPLSWLIRQLTQVGFAVTDMREIVPAEYFAKIDPRGYNFASEFPLWHLLEFRPFGS
jgi:SAM-dependent methyltransferase